MRLIQQSRIERVTSKLSAPKAAAMVCFLLAIASLAVAQDPQSRPMPWDRNDPSAIRWHLISVSAGSKKNCSQVYPVPAAAKSWTGCHSGEFSRCGGPPDCSCSDADDKLVWYHCKEGDYARCEDDKLCKEGDSD